MIQRHKAWDMLRITSRFLSPASKGGKRRKAMLAQVEGDATEPDALAAFALASEVASPSYPPTRGTRVALMAPAVHRGRKRA